MSGAEVAAAVGDEDGRERADGEPDGELGDAGGEAGAAECGRAQGDDRAVGGDPADERVERCGEGGDDAEGDREDEDGDGGEASGPAEDRHERLVERGERERGEERDGEKGQGPPDPESHDALPDNGDAAEGTDAKVTYDVIADHFGPGYNGLLIVTADIITSTDPVGLVDDLAEYIRSMDGVASVSLATPNQKSDTGITVADPELALVVTAGAALSLAQLLHDRPERDDAAAADQVAEDLLRMLGVPASEAKELARLPLPSLDAFDLAQSRELGAEERRAVGRRHCGGGLPHPGTLIQPMG